MSYQQSRMVPVADVQVGDTIDDFVCPLVLTVERIRVGRKFVTFYGTDGFIWIQDQGTTIGVRR